MHELGIGNNIKLELVWSWKGRG